VRSSWWFVVCAASSAVCSFPDVTLAPQEDCEKVGDEDDNGMADCRDPVCASTDACAGSCTDRMTNGDETDVDCGGRCASCDRASCSVDGDCSSGLCSKDSCVRASSCAEILAGGFSRGDGNYRIDLDGVGGEPPFAVKCDMTTDRGGWTRFNWVTGAYPASADPLEQLLSQCAVSDVVCRGRIPASARPLDLMVKDLADRNMAGVAPSIALWHFDATSTISNAVLGALRDKTIACLPQQALWRPYQYDGTEAFCGTGAEGGCDSFVYVNGTVGTGCITYGGWYLQLDGDTGCYNAAFKIGMVYANPPSGCEMVDVNYLDSGPPPAAGADDNIGELYYR
jgi:hypothetical protein